VEHGFAHVRTIVESGRTILGWSEIDFGALPEEAETLTLPGWGLRVAEIVATHKVNANAANARVRRREA
jgi:uncharacterized protein (DUF1697 family)